MTMHGMQWVDFFDQREGICWKLQSGVRFGKELEEKVLQENNTKQCNYIKIRQANRD